MPKPTIEIVSNNPSPIFARKFQPNSGFKAQQLLRLGEFWNRLGDLLKLTLPNFT